MGGRRRQRQRQSRSNNQRIMVLIDPIHLRRNQFHNLLTIRNCFDTGHLHIPIPKDLDIRLIALAKAVDNRRLVVEYLLFNSNSPLSCIHTPIPIISELHPAEAD